MLKRLTPREQFEQLVANFEPLIRKAFEDAIEDIKSRAEIGRIVERLERRDIDGTMKALHLDPAAFRPLDTAISNTFNGGGVATTGRLPPLREPGGGQVIIRFDTRNVRAEDWLRDHSGQLITNIVDDQRIAIRTAMVSGLERGLNPRSTALDIVGRINRVSGVREGGIIGLTAQQERFAASYLEDLLSGDPARMRSTLDRARRDKRFDRSVMKAINEGRSVDAELAGRMVGRYRDRLLQLRGETIARTETMAALNESQMEAMRQAVDGGVDPTTIVKVWHSAHDNRVRDSHREMHGQEVGLNGKFISPSGAMLAYPGDPSAPANEIINCRCWMETKIDFLAGLE
ncbi:phage minor head protein [Pseudaminobacter soli (ex Li et al. 2025)]|uniref:Head morphogenesis protein n=1 Tax=Pseudaminobacter soli (ex Li et al. 2025) TaxID=1295366 RepID=A0A2P7SE52_9HYPH|nr:phage minor head protein [Mesorhizobium soli]PSJ60747.1 head morphogenesis protein [Mesorhizobium soli]